MTGRERLIKVLNGEQVDRIPNAPFIFYNIIDEYFGKEKAESMDSERHDLFYIEKGIELYERFGFDIILRTANIFEYLNEISDENGKWNVQNVREGNEEEWTVSTTVSTPEKKLFQKKKYSKVTPHEIVEAITEYFIKDKDDFDQFVKYQPPMRQFETKHIAEARKILGDRGLLAPWAQGAFNSASFYRDVALLVMDPYIDEGFYREVIEYFSDRMFDLIKQLAAAGADIVCCGGNVANGTTAGPDFFTKHVLPFEKDFTGKVKDLGVRYLYHNCGNAKSLYTVYSSIGMDIFETLTAPPYADGDLELAFNTFDSDIVLSGNIDQIDFLVHAQSGEVRKKVKDILTLAKRHGNFILAASDYFSEGTPEENLRAYVDAALEYGAY